MNTMNSSILRYQQHRTKSRQYRLSVETANASDDMAGLLYPNYLHDHLNVGDENR